MSNRVFPASISFVTASASGSRLGARTKVSAASPARGAQTSSSNGRIGFTLELYQNERGLSMRNSCRFYAPNDPSRIQLYLMQDMEPTLLSSHVARRSSSASSNFSVEVRYFSISVTRLTVITLFLPLQTSSEGIVRRSLAQGSLHQGRIHALPHNPLSYVP